MNDKRTYHEKNPLRLNLDFKVEVLYSGEIMSKNNIVRSICPDHFCRVEVENEDKRIVGMATVRLKSADIGT